MDDILFRDPYVNFFADVYQGDCVINDIKYFDEKNIYSACTIYTEDEILIFRNANITPKKNGLFVATWKRNDNIPVPLDYDDTFDYLIIFCSQENNAGYFKFDKETLINQNLITSEKRKGKNGFRVYPDWVVPQSTQARKTKEWQSKFFYVVR